MPDTHGDLEKRLIGELVGQRYRMEALIGAGGMGAVFRAKDERDGSSVAVKALFPEFMAGEMGARFLRESELARSIQHPHVVPTLDSGHDAEHDIHFLVMPVMTGRDLEAVLGELGALDPVAAVRIALQAARGINAAHRLGIIHRDIKPANLFLQDEPDGEVIVRVCDFGVAKQIGAPGELTTTGTNLGTPDYVSPEQLRNAKDVDERADVWSLGATLYEMLCGVAPFSHVESVFDLITAIINDDVPHIQDRAPWIDPGLALVVHRALSREPNDRPATLEEFADELRPFSGGDELLLPSQIAAVPSARRHEAANRADLSMKPQLPQKTPEPDDLGLLGRKLSGKYKVVRMIGKGGMGAVYEVEDTSGRRLAAKVVALGIHGANPSSLQRFAREAKAASVIVSPNVIATYDAGTDEELGFPYIIMELLTGVDLSTLLKKEGALDAQVAVRLVMQGAQGVAAAHARGVVHRDIKPANLFLQIDPQTGVVTVKVCDFGVAKPTQTGMWGGASHFSLTRSGGMLGSPMYMSPEQAKNAKAVDERTDVWSLSVVLWEALSGARLWGGQTSLGELIVAICTEPIPRLEDLAPWVPHDLARVVHRGLERDPALRPQTVKAFIEQLEPFAGGSDRVTKDQLHGLSEAQRGELTIRVSLTESAARRAAALARPGVDVVRSSTLKSPTPPGKTVAVTPRAARKGGSALSLVGVAVASGAVAATLAYFGMRTALSDGTDAAAALTVSPVSAVTASLGVDPSDARVSVDGKPAAVINGSVILTGQPGDRFSIQLEHGSARNTIEVQLDEAGRPHPPRVGLR